MSVLERRHDTLEKSNSISIRNVLYATDFSAASEAALPYATAICRRFGSTMHVAHVLSDVNLLLMTGGVDYVQVDTVYDDSRTLAQEKIQRITDRLGTILSRTYLRHGAVWGNLSSIVADNAIDLIVLGTHGRTGAGKLLLGSVAEDISPPCSLPRFDRRAKSWRPGPLALPPHQRP